MALAAEWQRPKAKVTENHESSPNSRSDLLGFANSPDSSTEMVKKECNRDENVVKLQYSPRLDILCYDK